MAVLLAFAARPHVPFAQQPPAAPISSRTIDDIRAVLGALSDGRAFVPGEVIVKFRPGMNPADQSRALSLLRARDGERQSRWIGEALLVRSASDPESDVVAAMLARQPEVEWAQPNYVRRRNAAPNDPSYSRQWNMDAIRMPQAWDINPGANASVTIAVIDSGYTAATATHAFRAWNGSTFETIPVPVATNPDINASRVAPGRDFTFGVLPLIDFVGHGTHIAGTILEETNNSLGLAGIAHNARLLPLKACVGYWDFVFALGAAGIPDEVPLDIGGCPDTWTSTALRFAADNGAQVANLSFGGPTSSPLVQDAIRYAVSRGVFVAIAVGNEFEDGNPVEYPAAYAQSIDGAVAVGAINRSNRRAFYSNTGAHVELVAPGGDVRDGGASGLIYQGAVLPFDYEPFFGVSRPRFDRYGDVPNMGTSMAAPHVAGVAALLYSQDITNPAAIEAALKRFAMDLGPAGRDNEYGHGLIDARASLRGLGVAR